MTAMLVLFKAEWGVNWTRPGTPFLPKKYFSPCITGAFDAWVPMEGMCEQGQRCRNPGEKNFRILKCSVLQTLWNESGTRERKADPNPLGKAEWAGTLGQRLPTAAAVCPGLMPTSPWGLGCCGHWWKDPPTKTVSGSSTFLGSPRQHMALLSPQGPV